ncbi:MAG TPA: proton-conducting transporter membrane subunit [Kofleriaceae bacterium]|nr:proton-conducting transporter membrane subunit [Kofleriaceae bacterium]
MSALALVVAGGASFGAAGVLSLALGRSARLAGLVALGGAVIGGGLGLAGALLALANGWSGELSAGWAVPGGALSVGVDPLSAWFLAPLFGLGALAAVFGRRYLPGAITPAGELDLLIAAMAAVLVARHALLFLVAWEVMTLLAYLLVTRDHHEGDVRRAGWAYLIASHVAVLALLGLFVALGSRARGALDFASFGAAWQGAAASGILLLALLGFGIKAGVIGLHVWLPEAHAAAPSHVSALMSGVLIKLGVYGLVRTALLVSPGAWFAVALMLLGVAGAVAGIALALYQRDIKRVLAYSSVENVGVVLLGLGLGFWARGHGQPRLAAVAFAGGLLHLWNHALMKSLLFLAAGSLVHGSGTRDLERMGGLLRRMPWTGCAMIAGAIAISALPPLGAFSSEWLLYRGLADVGVTGAPATALLAIGAAASLALVGGLAALCFVRLVGIALLGAPRGAGAAAAHESPAGLVAPLVLLAAACVAAGMVAPLLLPPLMGALLVQLGAPGAGEPAALLAPIALVDAALVAAVLAAAGLVIAMARRGARSETWGCGYAAPSARMQYRASGFSDLLVERIVPRWLRGAARLQPPDGIFPATASFAVDTTDPVTRAAYEPLLVRWGERFARLRFLQQGNVHVYILYIVATAIAALAWVMARDWWWS